MIRISLLYLSLPNNTVKFTSHNPQNTIQKNKKNRSQNPKQRRCRGKRTWMSTWCAKSKATTSPPPQSSATTAVSGPRAPTSLRFFIFFVFIHLFSCYIFFYFTCFLVTDLQWRWAFLIHTSKSCDGFDAEIWDLIGFGLDACFWFNRWIVLWEWFIGKKSIW